MTGLQVRCERVIGGDDSVRRDVLFAVRLPKCIQLGPHVATLVVCMLVTRWHLLDCVDVHVDVRGRVR